MRLIEEFTPLVESLEPLPDDERARVLLYCLLKYAPSEFCTLDLHGLIARARNPANGRGPIPFVTGAHVPPGGKPTP